MALVAAAISTTIFKVVPVSKDHAASRPPAEGDLGNLWYCCTLATSDAVANSAAAISTTILIVVLVSKHDITSRPHAAGIHAM